MVDFWELLYTIIAGSFQKFVVFSWFSSEQPNIYPQKDYSDLVPHPPAAIQKLPNNIIASFNSEVCSVIDSNNNKKSGQYGKYTPEQKAVIGKSKVL